MWSPALFLTCDFTNTRLCSLFPCLSLFRSSYHGHFGNQANHHIIDNVQKQCCTAGTSIFRKYALHPWSPVRVCTSSPEVRGFRTSSRSSLSTACRFPPSSSPLASLSRFPHSYNLNRCGVWCLFEGFCFSLRFISLLRLTRRRKKKILRQILHPPLSFLPITKADDGSSHERNDCNRAASDGLFEGSGHYLQHDRIEESLKSRLGQENKNKTRTRPQSIIAVNGSVKDCARLSQRGFHISLYCVGNGTQVSRDTQGTGAISVRITLVLTLIFKRTFE